MKQRRCIDIDLPWNLKIVNFWMHSAVVCLMVWKLKVVRWRTIWKLTLYGNFFCLSHFRLVPERIVATKRKSQRNKMKEWYFSTPFISFAIVLLSRIIMCRSLRCVNSSSRLYIHGALQIAFTIFKSNQMHVTVSIWFEAIKWRFPLSP